MAIAVTLGLADVASWSVPLLSVAAIAIVWIGGGRWDRRGPAAAGAFAGAWALLVGAGYVTGLTRNSSGDAGCQFDCDDAAEFVAFAFYTSVAVISILVGVVVCGARALIGRFGRS